MTDLQKKTGFDFVKGETLLFNKPLNWTSFDVVNKVRMVIRKFSSGSGEGQNKTNLKVGHAGTLDPLATGLLIVCTGKMTKSIGVIQDQEKEYTGTMVLGASTPSYDLETTPDHFFGTSMLSGELILNTIPQFTGTISQVPPAYSAKSVNGVRAYRMARRGENPDLPCNEVIISEFRITEMDLGDKKTLDFIVRCSKGTYIRSLAHDFGKALGSGAYLSALCRTKIGEHKLEDAWELEMFIETLKISL